MPYPIPYDIWAPDLWIRRGPIQLYGLFKIANGQYLGFTENSFSMDWILGKVRVWDKISAEHYFKHYTGKYKDQSFFILRLTRTNSPIVCDFKTRHDQYLAKTLKKYDGRNVGFTMNPNWK